MGAALILKAIAFGLIAFILFGIVHWLCDFGWSYFLSALSFKGGQFFGKRFQKIIFIISGIFLLFLSGKFIIDGIKTL